MAQNQSEIGQGSTLDPQGRNYIDPNKISAEALPVIVLVDNRNNWFSWLIKDHTNGNYNHACIGWRIGNSILVCASQNPGGYKEMPITDYMKPNVMLKFWQINGLTADQISALNKSIQTYLNRKEWYDYLGILGQFLHLPWIHNPMQTYCSEMVADHLREALGWKVPAQISPASLNEWFLKNSSMSVLGYWWSD